MNRNNRVFIGYLGSLCLLAGCHGYAKPPPVRVEPAPTPTVDETGGPATEFYFQYMLWGGQGACPQLLVVTSNPRVNIHGLAPTYFRDVTDVLWGLDVGGTIERVLTWKEIYLVPTKVAAAMDDIVVERGFDNWESMLDAARSDGISMEVTVKTSSGRSRVIVSDDGLPSLVEDYVLHGKGQMKDDTPGRVMAKRMFDLVEEVRQLAHREGTAVKAKTVK